MSYSYEIEEDTIVRYYIKNNLIEHLKYLINTVREDHIKPENERKFDYSDFIETVYKYACMLGKVELLEYIKVDLLSIVPNNLQLNRCLNWDQLDTAKWILKNLAHKYQYDDVIKTIISCNNSRIKDLLQYYQEITSCDTLYKQLENEYMDYAIKNNNIHAIDFFYDNNIGRKFLKDLKLYWIEEDSFIRDYTKRHLKSKYNVQVNLIQPEKLNKTLFFILSFIIAIIFLYISNQLKN